MVTGDQRKEGSGWAKAERPVITGFAGHRENADLKRFLLLGLALARNEVAHSWSEPAPQNGRETRQDRKTVIRKCEKC